MDFAMRLKELIEERGTTIPRLASKANESRASVDRWVNGESKPNIDKAANLADALGVTLDYLAGRESRSELTGDERFLVELYRSLRLSKDEAAQRLATPLESESNGNIQIGQPADPTTGLPIKQPGRGRKRG